MEFHVTPAQQELRQRARLLAADFATRAAQHDREASDPVENYAALREAGFYGLNVPIELGGAGVGLLGWSLAAEELAQGCGSTALSFNMHLSVVSPMMESPLVPRAVKERLAKMKKGAVVINTARGPLIDETALYDAIKSGHIGGAGLDVFEVEPLDVKSPLLTLPSVLVSGHVAGLDDDSAHDTSKMCAEIITGLHQGRWPHGCVQNLKGREGWKWKK